MLSGIVAGHAETAMITAVTAGFSEPGVVLFSEQTWSERNRRLPAVL